MRVITSHHLRPRRRHEERIARSALRASVDAIVVVGSDSEHEPEKRRVPCIYAQSASDLNAAWFLCCATVKLIAGPKATPDQLATIQRALEAMP